MLDAQAPAYPIADSLKRVHFYWRYLEVRVPHQFK